MHLIYDTSFNKKPYPTFNKILSNYNKIFSFIKEYYLLQQDLWYPNTILIFLVSNKI